MIRKWKMHALFSCQQCDKEWGWYKTAQQNAAAHAKRTGHEVHGEIGYAARYNERAASAPPHQQKEESTNG